MTFCLNGFMFLLFVHAVVFQPLQGVPLHRSFWGQQADRTARGIVKPTTLNTTYKGSASFAFLNQTDIDKGLDHLKKKYPNVDWSLVAGLFNNNGKRELKESHEMTKRNATSTFAFLNQTDVDKGLDHLKKKYPNVDWSLVAGLFKNNGKRELTETITNPVEQLETKESKKRLSHLKKSLKYLDSFQVRSMQERNHILEEPNDGDRTSYDGLTAEFEFIEPEEEAKGLDYLKTNYPDIDWSPLTSLNYEDETLDA